MEAYKLLCPYQRTYYKDIAEARQHFNLPDLTIGWNTDQATDHNQGRTLLVVDSPTMGVVVLFWYGCDVRAKLLAIVNE